MRASLIFKRQRKKEMAVQKSSVEYKIVKRIAKLSDVGPYGGSGTCELNIVSFNNKPAKLDIRRWGEKDGQVTMSKGVTLSLEEMTNLTEAGITFLESEDVELLADSEAAMTEAKASPKAKAPTKNDLAEQMAKQQLLMEQQSAMLKAAMDQLASLGVVAQSAPESAEPDPAF
jgi:hypothetical protein